MPPVCELLAFRCPLCGSPVVRVREEGAKERLICAVCWAMGEAGGDMRRGTPIPAALKQLVDKARFPRAAAPAGTEPRDRPPAAEEPAATAGRAQANSFSE